MRKILCLTIATLCILFLPACSGSLASSSSPEMQQTPAPAASEPDFEEPTSLNLNGLAAIDSSSFPSRYDLRELGLVTEVKNQGLYGTCWAFCLANVMESNALVRGYGKFDLSEYQIAYMGTHILSDRLFMTESEGPKGNRVWYNDPYGGIFSSSIMQGYAIHTEDEYPYSNIEAPLPEDGVSIDGALYVDSCYTVPASDTTAMKELLMKNGSLYMCVCALCWADETGSYCDWSTGAAYLPRYTAKYPRIDHFVSVIGWDDHYSSEHFKTTPPGDGAWIIKNSWGTDYGDEPVLLGGELVTEIGDGGCFYVSYYDAAFNALNSATSITVKNERSYDRVYQYDGGVGLWYADKVTDVTIQISALENESITGVRIKPTGKISYNYFYCGNWAFEEASARIRVYKGTFDAASAEDAEPIYTQDYAIVYPDYQTIEFNKEVPLCKGEEYYIRVSFDRPICYALDGKQYLFYSYENVAGGNPGETFVKTENGEGLGEWYDTAAIPGKTFPSSTSACIKVLTKDSLFLQPENEEVPATDLTVPGAVEEVDTEFSLPTSSWPVSFVGPLTFGVVIIILLIKKKTQS